MSIRTKTWPGQTTLRAVVKDVMRRAIDFVQALLEDDVNPKDPSTGAPEDDVFDELVSLFSPHGTEPPDEFTKGYFYGMKVFLSRAHRTLYGGSFTFDWSMLEPSLAQAIVADCAAFQRMGRPQMRVTGQSDFTLGELFYASNQGFGFSRGFSKTAGSFGRTDQQKEAYASLQNLACTFEPISVRAVWDGGSIIQRTAVS